MAILENILLLEAGETSTCDVSGYKKYMILKNLTLTNLKTMYEDKKFLLPADYQETRVFQMYILVHDLKPKDYLSITPVNWIDVDMDTLQQKYDIIYPSYALPTITDSTSSNGSIDATTVAVNLFR